MSQCRHSWIFTFTRLAAHIRRAQFKATPTTTLTTATHTWYLAAVDHEFGHVASVCRPNDHAAQYQQASEPARADWLIAGQAAVKYADAAQFSYTHTHTYVCRCTLVWMQAFDFIIALQSQIIIKLNAAWNFAMSLLLLLLLVASMALQFFRSFAHWLIRFAFLVWRMSKQKLWKKGKKAIRKVFWDFSKAGRNPT